MLKATSGADTDVEDWDKLLLRVCLEGALEKEKNGEELTESQQDILLSWKCVKGELSDKEWPEKRVDNIGQNGNEGEHYEEVQLELPLDTEGC